MAFARHRHLSVWQMVRLRRCWLARTPYDKDGILAGNSTFDVLAAVQAGYTVVVQDVRGRYTSEVCSTHKSRRPPTAIDTLPGRRPWSNGRIGTFGGSYRSGTQLLPAREQPPALQTMAPSITFSDCYEGCSYRGGAKVLHDLRWVVANIVPAEMAPRTPPVAKQLLDSDLPFDVDGA